MGTKQYNKYLEDEYNKYMEEGGGEDIPVPSDEEMEEAIKQWEATRRKGKTNVED